MNREMKNSNIPWIGYIPASWTTCHIKQIMRNKSIKGYPNETVLSLYREYGVVPKDSRTDNHNITSEDTSNYKFVEIGDFVINKMKAWQGSMAVSDYQGIISPAYYICRFVSNDVCKRYIHYLLRNETYKTEYMRLSSGLRVGQWDLNIEDFLRIQMVLPLYAEQKAIADFLDKKCEEIDELVALQEKIIEELKAYKQSVITETVCKGLNPNAPMKDSGVEWIGEIPEHWSLCKLKNYLSQTPNNLRVGPFGTALSGNDIKESGKYWIYNQRTVLDENFTTCNSFVDEEKYLELESFKIYPNDILITTRGSIGKITIVPNNAPVGILHPCIIRFVIDENRFNTSLLKHIFNGSDFVLRQMKYQSNSTTIDVLYSYALKNIVLPNIPIYEQQEIADYLDKKCAEIDQLITIKQQKIVELKEYKKSLIYEYTTGKKRVEA